MLALTRFARLGAVSALLWSACGHASAVPTLEAPPQWQSKRARPPAPGVANCTGQPPATPHNTAATAWHDDDAALSSRAQRALHGGGKVDLDSYTGRCRLIDAEHDGQEPLNDGIDPEKLLKLLEEMDALNRTLSVEEEQALLERLGSRIYVQLDSTDNELHAYIGNGVNRQDLGQLSRLDPQYLAEDGDLVLHYGENERYAQAQRQMQNALGGANPMGLTAAVPEPSTYAMLLAGLALMHLMRRRKGGAGQRS